MQEKDTYSQRQSLLSEIDSVRQREVQLRRQQEIDNRSVLDANFFYLSLIFFGKILKICEYFFLQIFCLERK